MRPAEPAAGASLAAARPAATFWIAAVVLLAGFNLRPLFTSLGASLEAVRLDLGLSSGALGVLAALPALCMGIMSIRGGWLIDRIGTGHGMRLALALIAAGSAARWAGETAVVLYLATAAGGLGIAACQVLVPVVVKRHFPQRAAIMMGAFTMAMNLGAATGAAATELLSASLGGWRAALGLWGLPALVAACLWPASLAERRSGAASAGIPWRSALGWRLAVFLGGGSVAYMALLAWLVPLYLAAGASQADGVAVLTVFTGAQTVAALLVPLLAGASRDRRPALGLTLGSLLVGLVGFWLAPTAAPWVWAVLAGIGLGGSFPLALTLPLDYTDTPAEAGRLSAMMLGLAMLMGATGPAVFGLLRDGFGIDAGMGFLLVSAAIAFCLGLRFRPRAV